MSFEHISLHNLKKLLPLIPANTLKEMTPAIERLILLESKKACEESLAEFVRQAWSVIEPGQPYVHGWHIDAICQHLEAVTDGRIKRLLINVPPGCMKSLLLNVFWPSWEWTRKPHLRYVATAHNQALAVRDSTKMRRLISSEWYQKRWPEVSLTGDQNSKLKFENSAFGFREAVAFESMTGVRGDRVLIDDPHSVDSALSDQERQNAVTTFLEAIPTRLNNPATSAIVIIMQRLHEEDISGIALSKGLGYEHLMLPMEFDPNRACETSIGFHDPREEEGELLFPERFPAEVVERDKLVMGPYAVAGQFQQQPSPRGGGILKRDWWLTWDDAEAAANGCSPGAYPAFDYIVASLDPAFTEKKENDPSGFAVFGVWNRQARTSRCIMNPDGSRVEFFDVADGMPAALLMYAWAKRLDIHGPDVEREPGETEASYKVRTKASWGLVEHVMDACKRFNVDMLLIEAKGPGITVASEIKRLNKYNDFGVQLVDPGRADKVARAYACQHIFSGGQVFAPETQWAEDVIAEAEAFPRGAHDDRVDAVTQALRWLRDRGMLERSSEIINRAELEMRGERKLTAIYDV